MHIHSWSLFILYTWTLFFVIKYWPFCTIDTLYHIMFIILNVWFYNAPIVKNGEYWPIQEIGPSQIEYCKKYALNMPQCIISRCSIAKNGLLRVY